MKLLPRLVLIGVMAVAFAIGGALITLGAIAWSRGVSRVAIPSGSLIRQSRQGKIFVSTTVHYRNWRGRLYFAFVRPGHRVLTPFMVSVMIRQAKAEATRLEVLQGGATR